MQLHPNSSTALFKVSRLNVAMVALQRAIPIAQQLLKNFHLCGNYETCAAG